MTTWEEINKLSQLLKTTQDAKASHILPERTWVDIVSQVQEIYNIQLFTTLDGRYYLTQDELVKEIYAEVQCNNGRISIQELSININISADIISKIFSLSNELFDIKLICVFDELISSEYLDKIKREILDKVDEKGFMEITSLSTSLTLPESLISQTLSDIDKVPTSKFKKINDTLFSINYLTKLKSQVSGTLAAVFYPISVGQLSKALKISESLLISQIESLLQSKLIKGTLSSNKTTFTPEVYFQERLGYAKSFFEINNFIEFSFLKKLGINDPELFISNNFIEAKIFSNFAIKSKFITETSNNIKEIINEDKWIDLTHYIPSDLSHLSINSLIVEQLNDKNLDSLEGSSFIFTKSLFEEFIPHIQDYVIEIGRVTAKAQITNFNSQSFGEAKGKSSAKKTKDKIKNKKSTTSASGGHGGREIKTKSNKKKYMVGAGDDDDQEETATEFNIPDDELLTLLDIDHMVELVHKKFTNLPSELIYDILSSNWKVEICENLLLDIILAEKKTLDSHKSAVLGGGLDKEKLANSAKELDSMFNSMEAFENGANYFAEAKELHSKMIKSLIRQQGSHLVNYICLLLSSLYCVPITNLYDEDVLKSDDLDEEDNGYCKIQKPEITFETVNNEMRKKFIQTLSKINVPEMPRLIITLNDLDTWISSATVTKSLKEIMEKFDFVLGEVLSVPCQYQPFETNNKKKNQISAFSIEYAIEMETRLMDTFSKFKEIHLELKENNVESLHECPIADVESKVPLIIELSGTISLLSTSVICQAIGNKFPVLLTGKLVPDVVGFLKEIEIPDEVTDKPLVLIKEHKMIENLINMTSIILNLVKLKQNGTFSYQISDELNNISLKLTKGIPLLRKSFSVKSQKSK